MMSSEKREKIGVFIAERKNCEGKDFTISFAGRGKLQYCSECQCSTYVVYSKYQCKHTVVQ